MLKFIFFLPLFCIGLFSFGFNERKDSVKGKFILVSVTPNITGIYKLTPNHALGANTSVGVKIPINKKNNYSISAGFWYSPLSMGRKEFVFKNKDVYSFYYLSLPLRYQRKTKIVDFNFEITPLTLLKQNFIKSNIARKYNLNYSFDISKSIKIDKNHEMSFGLGFSSSRNVFYIFKSNEKKYYYRYYVFSSIAFLRLEFLFN